MRAKKKQTRRQRETRPLRVEALEQREMLSVSLTGDPEASTTADVVGGLNWGGVVISDQAKRLHKIDPKSGAAGLQPKLLGYTDVRMNDLAFSRSDVLYGVSEPMGSPVTSWLYRIDVGDYTQEYPYAGVSSTALFPILTPTGGAVWLNSLEFDVNTLYGVGEDRTSTTRDHAIFRIDLATGTATREIWLNIATGELAGKYHAAGDIDFKAPFGDGYVATIEQKTHSSYGQVAVLLIWHRDVAPSYLEARPVQAPILNFQGLTYGRFGTGNVLIAYPQQNWPATQVKKVRNLDLSAQPWQWREYGDMTLNSDVLGAAMLQVNNPPTVVNDQSEGADNRYTVSKNQTLVVAAPGVLSNDFDLEHDPITVKSNSQPLHGTLKNGKVNPDGSFEYTPIPNYFGQDSFTYVANDGFSDSNSAVVAITVLGTAAPIARDDTDRYSVLRATVGQPTELVVDAGHGVLINDTSYRPGHPFTAVRQTNATHGVLTFLANGSFTYRPSAGFVGLETFTYKAFDNLQYSDRTATVAIQVFDPLGAVGFAQRAGQNPTQGELWYQFQTVRAGFATVEAVSSGVSMSLYRIQNERLQKLADSSSLGSRQRINWQAAGPAEVYYVKLTGTDNNVTLRAANLVGKSGQTLSVYGTSGADHFELNSASLAVTVNGVVYVASDYGSPPVTAVNFSGDPGNSDAARITGSSADETFTGYLRPNSSTFSRTGLTATLTNVRRTTVTGGSGADVASLYDSSGNDTLTAKPDYAELTDGTYVLRAEHFTYTHSYATKGGTDVASLYGSSGDDTFSATPPIAVLKSPGVYYHRTKFFEYVHAYGSPGTTDGHDVAYLKGTTRNDIFVGYPTWARMKGPRYNDRVKFFDAVYADATQGGTDTAELWDDVGVDSFTFTGNPTVSETSGTVSGNPYLNRARGFEEITVRAKAGGTDEAVLNDSSGNDSLTRGSDWAQLANGVLDFLYKAIGFPKVKAKSTSGTDTAVVNPIPPWLTLEGPWVVS